MNKLLIMAGMACLPLHHISLSSSYGYRLHPITGHYAFHSGVDLRASHDTVFAVLNGVVEFTGYNGLLGVFIRLEHGDFQSSYGHLSQILVLPGDTVNAGDPIAISGATGRVTGPHLHFSIAFHHHSVDPLKFLLNIQNLNQNNKETKP